MPPLVIVVLGALGVAALARVIAAETRRVNEALNRQKAAEETDLSEIPRLKRDPVTGEYRPPAS